MKFKVYIEVQDWINCDCNRKLCKYRVYTINVDNLFVGSIYKRKTTH
jgi:hypothetical protein